jgi:alpha-1,3-rhamnosyl/mannosyltransferase
LVRALATLGTGDELLVLRDPAATSRHDVAGLEGLGGVRLVPARARRSFAAEQWCLPTLLRRLVPDVFHAPFFVTPFFIPCPSVVTIHDLIPLDHPRPREDRFFRTTTRLACRRARAVLVPSEWARHALVERLGLPTGKVHVTSLGADPERFRPAPAAAVEALRRRRGLPQRYVLALGSNEPHKNLRGLLAAWAKVERQDPDLGLVVAGRESPRHPAAAAVVRAEQLARPVVLLGDVPEAELPALYTGAMCLAQASLAEGFGLPVLEAMACGTPVVCSTGGALPELVGDAAILVDPTDTGALAAAIRRVAGDATFRQSLRAPGLARAARFSWEATARATRAAYRAAVG